MRILLISLAFIVSAHAEEDIEETFRSGIPSNWEIIDNIGSGGAVWEWRPSADPDWPDGAFVSVDPATDENHEYADTVLLSSSFDLDGWNRAELWLSYEFDDAASTASADVAMRFVEIDGPWETIYSASPEAESSVRVYLWAGSPPQPSDKRAIQLAFRFKNNVADAGYWKLFRVYFVGTEESEVGTDDDDDSLEYDDVGNVDDDDNDDASCCGC
ncbi:MAG: hypothetical protein M5R36_23360 [Deltaproteobacteria bacterium]|nr:hypothetical protein [Deltaproteobacteria bacterium]